MTILRQVDFEKSIKDLKLVQWNPGGMNSPSKLVVDLFLLDPFHSRSEFT